MSAAPAAWPAIANVDDVPSPALLVYPGRIEANIRRMLEIAGDARRLRPHVKTHKLAEVVRLQQQHGIQQFKCATLAEVELVAACGARHVLFAYQPVGPNVRHLVALAGRYPATRFAALIDDPDALARLSAEATRTGRVIEAVLDLDSGMHRTGLLPGPAARALYAQFDRSPGVIPGGLHAYDGHLCDPDPRACREAAIAALAPVLALAAELRAAGMTVPRIVAGGTPTFAAHAATPDVECSPGTCLLWDVGYGEMVPDAGFVPAALVLTRVVSKPGPRRLCLDLGYKAIAAERPPPRVRLIGLEDALAVMHNEEHLVIETARADAFRVGDPLYGVPWHICPTVALHASAVVVRDGRATVRRPFPHVDLRRSPRPEHERARLEPRPHAADRRDPRARTRAE